jgi:methylaspartate mutase epsilon subunit
LIQKQKLQNRRWDDSHFVAERGAVLTSWPTGVGVDLAEAFAFHRTLPENKRAYCKLRAGHEAGHIFLQPRAGVALLSEHLVLLSKLEMEGQADFLPTTIDSYTRQNRYEEAQKGIEESKLAGRSLLNGFPAVNYGVANCRKIIEAAGVPVQVRHGTPDARLLAEITLAAGFSDFEGGGVSYNIPYARDIPLDLSIYHWQYVDRLCGAYAENNIIINREMFGPLTGTLVPPCISHAMWHNRGAAGSGAGSKKHHHRLRPGGQPAAGYGGPAQPGPARPELPGSGRVQRCSADHGLSPVDGRLSAG